MVIKAKIAAAKSCPARFATTVFTALVFLLLSVGLAGLCGGRVLSERAMFAAETDAAPESWHQEFDAVCGKTEDAMTFSEEELMTLIRRCDTLRPRIEKLDESRKKVYLERLRKCRGLYAYVLDAKKKEKK